MSCRTPNVCLVFTHSAVLAWRLSVARQSRAVNSSVRGVSSPSGHRPRAVAPSLTIRSFCRYRDYAPRWSPRGRMHGVSENSTEPSKHTISRPAASNDCSLVAFMKSKLKLADHIYKPHFKGCYKVRTHYNTSSPVLVRLISMIVTILLLAITCLLL